MYSVHPPGPVNGLRHGLLGQQLPQLVLWLGLRQPVQACEMTGQVSGEQLRLLVGGVVGVDEGRLGDGVVVVGVVVLHVLAGLGVLEDGVGGALAAGGDVVAADDPEAVDAGLVLDRVQLAVVAHVLVLSDAVVAGGGLLLDDDAVLLLRGVSELVVAHVEPLLLDDLGQAGVAVVPGGGELRRGQAHAGQEQDTGCNLRGSISKSNLQCTAVQVHK